MFSVFRPSSLIYRLELLLALSVRRERGTRHRRSRQRRSTNASKALSSSAWFCADKREIFKRIPIAARETIRFEPPALIKGKAFPANGTKPTITAILINASKASQILNPAAINLPNPSGALWEIFRPRHINKRYKTTRPDAPKNPVSSPTTAQILSVGGTGKPVSFVLAWPIPTPSQPPLTKASSERDKCIGA